MKKLVMAGWALAMGAGVFAAIVPEAEYTTFDRAPIFDYLTDARATMSLDGEWELARQKEKAIKFKNDRDEPRQRWEELPFDPATSKWQKVTLPKAIDPFFGNIMHYRRTFDLTPEQAAKAVVIKSEMISGAYNLFVNGKEVAYVPQPFGFEMRHDLTGFVKGGTNEICFKMRKGNATRVWEDRLDGTVAGEGIIRPIFLEFSDKVSIEDVRIVTKVEPEKIWTAKVTIKNRTDAAATVEVGAEIEDVATLGGDASSVGKKEGENPSPDAGMRRPPKRCVTIPANGSKVVELSFPWKDAKLWSPASPELYYAKFEVFGRLGEATLPKGAADGRVGSPSRPVVDSYRQRFGFREITCVGTQIRLNGKPFMMRRQTYGANSALSVDELKRYRSMGYVGLRLFMPNNTERVCRLADEFGFLLTPCVTVGCVSWVRSDTFWKIYESILAEMVTRLGNHPSIVCWGVSNEFGYVYGGAINVASRKKEAEAAIRKQQKAAKVVEEMDPTRPWTACGEAEMGWPAGAPGPMPIISMHYPFPAGADWARLPSAGYWYAEGGGGWQGMTRREKPACISEDLYHGLYDEFMPLSKVGGDTIFTPEGCAATIHEATRYFTEGHYAGGLAGWEPWAVSLGYLKNKLPENGRGPLHPDYLIAIKGFEPNLFAGKPETRPLYAYNQWFTPVKGKLVTEMVLKKKGLFSDEKKLVSTEEDVFIDIGGRFEKDLTIPAPEVDEPTVLEVRMRLVGSARSPQRAGLGAGGRLGESTLPETLAERTYRFNVFPKDIELAIPKGTALLAATNSPLCRFKFPKGVHTRAADAVKSGATRIVVDVPLTIPEGQALDAFVQKGGFVLLARTWPDTWLPTTLDNGKCATKIFRRSEGNMNDVLDDSLRVWRVDPADDSKWKETAHRVCTSAYRPPAEDSLVLFDAGFASGVTHAAVLWLWRGRGGWLLNATDAVRKLDCEPAAGAFVQSLVRELARAKMDRLTKTLVFNDPLSPLAKFLAENNFAAAKKVTGKAKDAVLVVDAEGKPLPEKTLARIKKLCAAGGTAAIFNMTQETNTAVLDMLKIGWVKWESPQVEIPWGARGRMAKNDNGPKFVTRRDNKGVMKGIPNDWLFWWNRSKMYSWIVENVYGSNYTTGLFKDVTMVMNGVIAPRADFDGKILTDVPAMALAKVGKGVVLFSTLKMNENLETIGEGNHEKNGVKIAKLLRALFNNLGARTTRTVHENVDWMIVDFRKEMTRTLWENPAYKDAKGWMKPEAVFRGADLRYFPVNNCGWSLQANNYCPVDPFPEDPLLFNGVPFKIQNPETNDRLAALFIRQEMTKEKPIRIPLPPKTRIKKIHFLGAHQWGIHELHFSFGELTEKSKIVFDGKHIGDFSWGVPTKLAEGKTAWLGKGGEKGKKDVALYMWAAENPNPKEPVPFLEFYLPPPPKGRNTSAGILAITIERAERSGVVGLKAPREFWYNTRSLRRKCRNEQRTFEESPRESPVHPGSRESHFQARARAHQRREAVGAPGVA